MKKLTLTKEEYLQEIERLKQAAFKVGYELNVYAPTKYLYEDDGINQRSSLWHGGLMATLEKINTIVDTGAELVEMPLSINIEAMGDVCIDIDNDTFKDKANAGRVGWELRTAGFNTDEELYEELDKGDDGRLYIDSNNWYEISGTYCKQFIDLEYVSDYDDYLETIQEVIDNIKNIESWIKDAV